MNKKILKVSSIMIAIVFLMPVGIWTLGSRANPVYENDGEEHLVISYAIPEGSIDGIVGDEWPVESQVGNLWFTGEDEPIGNVYMTHSDGILNIGAVATYPETQMNNDGHWVKIDWDRDTSLDFDDNMGNSDTEFAYGQYGFEYAITMDMESMVNDRFNILLHGEITGIQSSPNGETTTFPFREPGPFFSTTMVLEYPIPEEPPEPSPGPGPTPITVPTPVTNPEEPITVPEPVTEPVSEPGPIAVTEPIAEPVFTGPPNLTYTIDYLYPADITIVNSRGIYFYASGNYPLGEHSIPFDSTYRIPEKDYGTYPLYDDQNPLWFRINIVNNDPVEYKDIRITATQEVHNTLTLRDSLGSFNVVQGDPLDGTPLWWNRDIQPNGEVTLIGCHHFSGRAYGLEQTHIVIIYDGQTLFDDPEAGVYCPP